MKKYWWILEEYCWFWIPITIAVCASFCCGYAQYNTTHQVSAQTPDKIEPDNHIEGIVKSVVFIPTYFSYEGVIITFDDGRLIRLHIPHNKCFVFKINAYNNICYDFDNTSISSVSPDK